MLPEAKLHCKPEQQSRAYSGEQFGKTRLVRWREELWCSTFAELRGRACDVRKETGHESISKEKGMENLAAAVQQQKGGGESFNSYLKERNQ